MMSEKITKYHCLKCGLKSTYPELKKKEHYSVGKMRSFIHQCPNCNNEEFAIYSQVKTI